jgi:hypothetical protein
LPSLGSSESVSKGFIAKIEDDLMEDIRKAAGRYLKAPQDASRQVLKERA